MKKINIRESLLQFDKDTSCQYDLTSLYEACALDEEDKKKLVQYIDAKDIDATNRFLSNKAGEKGLMEEISDDISDDELKDLMGDSTDDYLKENWTDVYKQFNDLVDKLYVGGNEQEVNDAVEALYRQHEGEADWDNAWLRWLEPNGDPSEDPDYDKQLAYWKSEMVRINGNPSYRKINESSESGEIIKSTIDDAELEIIEQNVIPDTTSFKATYISGDSKGDTRIFIKADDKGTDYLETLGFTVDTSYGDRFIDLPTECLKGEDFEGSFYMTKNDFSEYSDLKESIEDDSWDKSEVINWLEEHTTAWEDVTDFFGSADLSEIDLDDILGWISEHNMLYDDFLTYFGEDVKSLFDESLDEDSSVNPYECRKSINPFMCIKTVHNEWLIVTEVNGKDIVGFTETDILANEMVPVEITRDEIKTVIDTDLLGEERYQKEVTPLIKEVKKHLNIDESLAEEWDKPEWLKIYGMFEEKAREILKANNWTEDMSREQKIELIKQVQEMVDNLYAGHEDDYDWNKAWTEWHSWDNEYDEAGEIPQQHINEDIDANALEQKIKDKTIDTLLKKYDEEFVHDYCQVQVGEVEDNIQVRVNAEVSYSDLEDLGTELTKVITEFDPHAYFEPECPGRLVAYVRKDQSEDIIDEETLKLWTDKFNAVNSRDELFDVYAELVKVRDEINSGTLMAIYELVDDKINEFPELEESLNEATDDNLSEDSTWVYDGKEIPRELRSKIKKVIIKPDVTEIGNYAFYKCTSLTSITIPDSVTTIGNSAFNECTRLGSVKIGNSVTTIGKEAFRRCYTLNSVRIPDSVTSIGEYAFQSCESLQNVVIGKNIKEIKLRTFAYCSKLTNIIIPNNVVEIDGMAFEGCYRLSSATIPDSVTYIGRDAFKVDILDKLIDGYVKLTIKCNKNSYAYKYAQENNIPVQTLNESLTEDTPEKYEFTYNEPEFNKFTVGGKDVPYTSHEEAKAHMKEDYPMESFVNEISEYLKGNNLYYTPYVNEEDSLVIEVEDGDWKHEHLYLDRLIGKFFFNRGLIVDSSKEITDSDDSDTFSAKHYYTLSDLIFSMEMKESLKENFTNIISLADSCGSNNCEENDNNIKFTFINNDAAIAFKEELEDRDITFNVLHHGVISINKETVQESLEENTTSNKTFSQWFDEVEDSEDTEFYPFDNYVKMFPNAEVLKNVTALDIRNNAHKFYDAYPVDSIDREKAFNFASEELNIDYNVLYDAWLHEEPINESLCEELPVGATSEEIRKYLMTKYGMTTEQLDKIDYLEIPYYSDAMMDYLADEGDLDRYLEGEMSTWEFRRAVDYAADYLDSLSADDEELEVSYGTVSNNFKDGTWLYDGKKIPNDITPKIKKVIIKDGVTTIESHAFYACDNLTSVIIPDSVIEIGEFAFCRCKSLQSVAINNNVTSISPGAFQGCSNLKSVIIPDSVTEISSCIFKDCTSLTSITIPNSVTTIGHSAFQGCSNLKSVIIPDSVTKIDSWAFVDCTNLENMTISSSVKSFGFIVFQNCKNLTIKCNKNSYAYEYAQENDIPVAILNESLNEELWDSSRVTDLVCYFLTKYENMPIETLQKKIFVTMKEEGSKLPDTSTFKQAVMDAVDNFNDELNDMFIDEYNESVDKSTTKSLYMCNNCHYEVEMNDEDYDGCCPMCHEHHGDFDKVEEGIVKDAMNVGKAIGKEIKNSNTYKNHVQSKIDKVKNSDSFKNISKAVKDTDTYKQVKKGVDNAKEYVKNNIQDNDRTANGLAFEVDGKDYKATDLKYSLHGKPLTADEVAKMSAFQRRKVKMEVPKGVQPLPEGVASATQINWDDDDDFTYDADVWEDDMGVASNKDFFAEGSDYTWVERVSSVETIDFDNWAVWSALNQDTGETEYFVVEEDTEFIDWGPVDTEKEAKEFLQSKVNDYNLDESFDTSISTWYSKNFPDDEVGIEQLDGISFNDIKKDISIIDHCDTQVRERILNKILDYNTIDEDVEELNEDWVMSLSDATKDLNDADKNGFYKVMDNITCDPSKCPLDQLENEVVEIAARYTDGNASPEYEGEDFTDEEYSGSKIYNAILKLYGRENELTESVSNKTITIDKDYFYDKVVNCEDEEVSLFVELGWDDDSGENIIIPKGTQLTYLNTSNPGGAGYHQFKLPNREEIISFVNDDEYINTLLGN